MAVHPPRQYTVEEFEAFVWLPENADLRFELIDGEMIEVPSNPYSSELASTFNRHVGNFVYANKLGHVTSEAAGYIVNGQRLAPDMAFVSKTRQKQLAREGYNPIPPDLAVEVVSPTDRDETLEKKLKHYAAAGVLVWVAYPKRREIDVHAPNAPRKTLGMDDILDGGTVLPGFTIAVKDIFADPLEDEE